jgi:hypothetical protein
MAEPENATLRMLREIRAEQQAMRDDFRVLSAIAMRIDTTTSSILEQLRLMFGAHNRLADRVRDIEARVREPE